MNKIGFIGAGNMAGCLIGGLIKSGYSKEHIRASDPLSLDKAKQLGIQVINDNEGIANWADILILAVKPQMMQQVCTGLAGRVSLQDKLVVSIAAGIRSSTISNWLGADIACIRVMPNTPALIGLGMSGLYANSYSRQNQVEDAINIMQTVGQVLPLESEDMMDVVTAVSGSGPAYYFLFMEMMIKAAMQKGLNEKDAKLLVTQTAIGAASMANDSEINIESLRKQVTSPGGTTERGIQAMLDGNIVTMVNDAIEAATKRSVELSNEMVENDNE